MIYIDERTYWPFPVVSEAERTEQQCREIDFLERAYSQGFKPYAFGAGNYSAISDGGRSGDILVRGRSRWEVVLGADDARFASAYVDDFASAADAVLSWLGGGDTPTILAKIEAHLASMSGSDRLFVVHARAATSGQR